MSTWSIKSPWQKLCCLKCDSSGAFVAQKPFWCHSAFHTATSFGAILAPHFVFSSLPPQTKTHTTAGHTQTQTASPWGRWGSSLQRPWIKDEQRSYSKKTGRHILTVTRSRIKRWENRKCDHNEPHPHPPISPGALKPWPEHLQR